MAGGFSSQWTNMGSNSNSSVDSGTSGGGTTGTLRSGISNHQTATTASGTNNQVRRECTVWNVDTNDFSTPAFLWPFLYDIESLLTLEYLSDLDPA